MHVKWIGALFLGLIVGFLVGPGISPQGVGQEPKKKIEAAERSITPDIKVGVRLQFISANVSTMLQFDDRAPKVSKIQGNWVYLHGEVRGPGANIGSGWVNFNNVQWYRIISE